MFTKLEKINAYVFVLCAILMLSGSVLTTPAFIYASTIGLLSSLKGHVKDGIIINTAFLIMNICLL